MRGVYKCERCGTLGHKAAICRAPNDVTGACRTCGAYGHVSRQCRISRNHVHVVAAVPPTTHWPPLPFAERAKIEAERVAWQEQRGKSQARVDALIIVEELYRN